MSFLCRLSFALFLVAAPILTPQQAAPASSPDDGPGKQPGSSSLVDSFVTPPLDPGPLHRGLSAPKNGNEKGGPAKTTPGAPATESPAPASDPASLFDRVSPPIDRVVTTVEVESTPQELDSSQPQPFVAGGAEIVSSAGTYGDLSRFLQILPGVVATSDMSNEIVVRGGQPMENLFLVDGIETPNINHIATLGTTGGFAPMIDSGVVQSVSFSSGGYDASLPERLSSVTEIHTLDDAPTGRRLEGDLGIEGLGGLAERRLAGGDLLTSAHHGIMDAMGNNMGINGIPTYTNEFSRFRRPAASGDQFSALNLAGWDTVSVTPCSHDAQETSTIDSQYNAWRETTGAEWRHVHSPTSFAVIDASDSEQVEHIHQEDQLLNPANLAEAGAENGPCPPASVAIAAATPVYAENSNSAFSTAGFRYEQQKSRLMLSGGSAVWLERPHYRIDQPIGAYSPYSAAPTRADSTSFHSDSSTVETGTYLNLSLHPASALSLSLGGRLQTFAFGSHLTMTPRASARYELGANLGVHAAFAEYAQMPPYVYLLAYPGNRSMEPMRATHQIAGLDYTFERVAQLRLEAYNKVYRDMPAATEYPSVTLEDMVDMLGQQFVWLPMNSGGTGDASGVELSDFTRIGSRFTMRASVAYSRARFAGLDGISRPGNYDYPWIVNAAGLQRLGRGYEISARYGYATGRPYTPFDIPDSTAQNRPIYAVSAMNAVRAPFYSRLDMQLNKGIAIRGALLELYGGAENLLNRQNFLSYVWLPRCQSRSSALPVQELYQIPIFPTFGIRFIAR